MPRGVNEIMNRQYGDYICNNSTKKFNTWRSRTISIFFEVNGLALNARINLTNFIHKKLDWEYQRYEQLMTHYNNNVNSLACDRIYT